jgi:hypothetical protein
MHIADDVTCSEMEAWMGYRVPIYGLVVISTVCCLSCQTAQVPTGDQEKTWLAKAYRYDENGWIFLHTEGAPFARGFQRGYLTANEIDEFLRTLAYTEEFQTGHDLNFFVQASSRLFRANVPAEYVAEMRGIVAGMERAGKKVTYEQVLYMNGFIDILWYWWPQEKKRSAGDHPGCSAFIATGDATADRRIVMAHNSWVSYTLGKSANILIDIVPERGHRILMQSWGPCIYSATDFFLTGAGLIGTETTIGDFEHFDRRGTPVFARARQAMQYANSLDEWADILIRRNNGAYANSWLLGDIKTGEIACLELGLKHHSLEKKKNGYFTGHGQYENLEAGDRRHVGRREGRRRGPADPLGPVDERELRADRRVPRPADARRSLRRLSPEGAAGLPNDLRAR